MHWAFHFETKAASTNILENSDITPMLLATKETP